MFGTATLHGQGTIRISNCCSLSVYAPITDENGVKLAGPAYVAELLAGAATGSLTPIGITAVFGTGAKAGCFDLGEKTLPGIAAGTRPFFQVRAWEVASGAAYDGAWHKGASAVFQLDQPLGNPSVQPPVPPPCLEFPPFSLVTAASGSGEIRSGETKVGNISTPSDMDTWTFYGDKGDRVIITVLTNSGTLMPHIYLYPPGGTGYEAIDNVEFGRLDHQLRTNGVYTIVIEDDALQKIGSYNITLLKMPGPVSSPGDPDGGTITSGQTLSGIINAPTETDAFQFYGTNNDRVIISVVTTNATMTTRVFLYPPGGGNSVASGGRLDHQLRTNGLYTIEIEAEGLKKTGAYNITFNKIPPTLPPGIYNPYPAIGATVSNFADSFRWDAVPGATGYDLRFGENVTTPLATIGANFPSATWPFPAMQPAKLYYWQVIAYLPGSTITGPFWWFIAASNQPCLTITSQPRNQTNNPGATVTFTVGATGTSPLNYRWRFNGTPLSDIGQFSGVTTPTLTIANIQHGNTGWYSVLVSNSCDSMASADAYLLVRQPPVITSQPVNHIVGVGDTVTFAVEASGTPPFTYQWQLSGADIAGATGPSYTMPNAQWNQGGYYSVVVSNPAGSVTSAAASLSFLDVAMYAGLTIGGPVGAKYKVEYTSNLDNPVWLELTNFTLPTSPYRFVDWDSVGAPKRFYRAVQQ